MPVQCGIERLFDLFPVIPSLRELRIAIAWYMNRSTGSPFSQNRIQMLFGKCVKLSRVFACVEVYSTSPPAPLRWGIYDRSLAEGFLSEDLSEGRTEWLKYQDDDYQKTAA